MSLSYRAIQWNRQKRLYDLSMAGFIAAALGAWFVVSLATQPYATAETLIIRGTAIAAFALLHLILCIGPLARLDARWLPVLYNRRHLGVAMFLLALIHAAFSTLQFHGFGDANPIISIFTAYRSDYLGLRASRFPFEPLGAAALAILFVMAATSHDFWLRNLGASLWKRLHQLVYPAYGLLLAHVALGALQSERHIGLAVLTAAGLALVVALHLAAAAKEARIDRALRAAERDGWSDACAESEVEEGRGKSACAGGQRVALFRKEGRVFALSNACRHQGGPLGEGRIVDGCATCPWHGWSYRVEDGQSPPPFKEVVPTYAVRVEGGRVLVRIDP